MTQLGTGTAVVPPVEFKELLAKRNGLPELLKMLEQRYPAAEVLNESGNPKSLGMWEQCAFWLKDMMRIHDAIAVLTRLYELVVVEQTPQHSSRARGSSLVWLSDWHRMLNHPSLAHRYLMLTLVDEAVSMKGKVYYDGGGYWRARWVFGMSDKELEDTCARIFAEYEVDAASGRFPEWVLQTLGDTWKTILPSPAEAGQYVISTPYAEWLLKHLEGDTSGRALELLACYLLSSIPGCRARKEWSHSTDYDVVCAIDGAADDFRRDLGRYFLCECKYWKDPADFTTIAKFARVLESSKCQFGILFSAKGITGNMDEPKAARRELLKLYHDTGIVVVVVDFDDLRNVVAGANLIVMLRGKYETVRLDLKGRPQAAIRP